MSARLAFVALLATLAATGTRAQTAALGDIRLSDDADHFSAWRFRGGALTTYRSPFDFAGVAAQTTHYTQLGWHADAPAVLFILRKQKRETLAGVVAEGGVVRVAGRIRTIGDATWSLRPAAHTGIELIASADLVETRRAVENAVAYRFGAVSIEQQWGKRFTAIGLAGAQRFTDGNKRVHLRGRLIWMLVPSQGLSAQFRWRQYRSSQLDVGGAYFDPRRYREWQGGLAIRKRYAGWVWSGTLAAGREEIDGGVQQTTKFAEVRGEGPIGKRARLALNASYNRAATFGTADDAWYRTVGVTLIVPF